MPYHTLDSAQAIERIMEAKGRVQNEDYELERQYKIFKMIRERSDYGPKKK